MKIEVNTHEKNMIRFAAEHPEVLVMSADLGSSCEVKKFRQTYPDRYLTMGIAEQNMCSWAAGMCREGYRPFLHTFAVFLYRRILDQLEMSVAYPNLPVVFVGFVPGITTPGGVTHQSINDIGVLRTVPNMAIFDIGDATEIEGVLDLAYNYNGPVYIRMLRKEVPRLFPANEPMQFNRARVLSEGDDIVLLSSSICTEEAMRATAVLKEKGVSVQHMHVSTRRSPTRPSLRPSRRASTALLPSKPSDIGGLSSAVADVIAENGLGKRLVKIGLPGYPHGASKMYLMKKYGIDAMHLVSAVEDLTGKKLGVAESDLEAVRFVDFLEV
ncbi:MAG: transketolase family protein [Butyricicoccus sp.]